MKLNLVLTLLLLFSGLHINAQKTQKADSLKTEYLILQNIPYRDFNSENLDDYARKNCLLDIYYPADKKGFATLVWLHGGGLSGGNKEMPESNCLNSMVLAIRQ